MIKESLKGELDRKKQETLQKLNTSEVVKEVKLLMESDATEDMRILRGVAGNSLLIRDQDTVGKMLELEKFEKEYVGDVFTIEQIKELAINYHLRFLPSHLYIGKMDVEVISKIKEFAKVTNSNISDVSLSRKFFILAPQEQFKLENFVIPTAAQLRAEHDPVMFYQIDETHYKFIHKWGKDFSVFRLIEGIKWKSLGGHFFVTFFKRLPIFTLLYSIIVCMLGCHMTIFQFIPPILLTILNWRFGPAWDLTDEGVIEEKFFSDNTWKSKFFYKRG